MTPAEKIATLLDEERPNWYNEVDTNTLSMDDFQKCLMGQLYGQYSTGRQALGISPVDAASYGIVVPDVVLYDDTADDEVLERLFDEANVALRDDIVAEIEARRSFDRGVESMRAEQRELELEATYA